MSSVCVHVPAHPHDHEAPLAGQHSSASRPPGHSNTAQHQATIVSTWLCCAQLGHYCVRQSMVAQHTLPWQDSKNDQLIVSPQPSFDWRDTQSKWLAHLNCALQPSLRPCMVFTDGATFITYGTMKSSRILRMKALSCCISEEMIKWVSEMT